MVGLLERLSDGFSDLVEVTYRKLFKEPLRSGGLSSHYKIFDGKGIVRVSNHLPNLTNFARFNDKDHNEKIFLVFVLDGYWRALPTDINKAERIVERWIKDELDYEQEYGEWEVEISFISKDTFEKDYELTKVLIERFYRIKL